MNELINLMYQIKDLSTRTNEIALIDLQPRLMAVYDKLEIERLSIADVSVCLERAKKYARHQHFLGGQGKELVEFEDWKAKD